MKLKYAELLSNFAFNVNLRRYIKTSAQGAETPIWLATSDAPEVVATGGYFGTASGIKPGPSIALESSEASRDPQVVGPGSNRSKCPSIHFPTLVSSDKCHPRF
jgi:hypothetical protein